MDVKGREEKKLEKRKKIIDIAEKMVFSKGYEGTTMDEVAHSTHLAKGTLYLYFQSKEELYYAVVTRGLKLFVEKLKQALAKEKTGMLKVKAVVQVYFNFYKNHLDYFKILPCNQDREILPEMFPKNSKTFEELSFYAAQIITLTFEVLQQGIQDGTIRKDIDVRKTLVIFSNTLTGVMRVFLLQKEFLKKKLKMKEKDVVDYYFDFLFRALRP